MQLKIKIQNYKFVFESKKQEQDFKNKIISLEGKFANLELKKFVKKRTTSQNAYYWGVVLPIIAEETGNDIDDLHTTFKAMFLVDRTGKIPVVKSSAKLTTVEFIDFTNKVVLFASQELNLEIPEPKS